MNIRAVFVAVLLLGTATAVAENPSVLFIQNVNGHLRHSPQLVRDLHREGFDVQFIQSWNDPDRGRTFRRLIPKANVVVMVSAAKAMADGSVHPVDQAYFDEIKSFVEAGGGLFYQTGERYPDAVASWVTFSRQWGLSGSVERVFGTDCVQRTVWGVSFTSTDRIEPSPVTEGVRRLWYPVYDERPMFRRSIHGELNGYYPCQALVFNDPAWQVVVRGSDTCHSEPPGKDPEMEIIRRYARPHGFDRNPPLFGIRELGKGRAAFSGISEAYFTGYASVDALEGITWCEGIDGQPSDGRRLFLNTLRWLAEPSMRARGKGGLEHDASLEQSEDMPPVPPVADWSKFQFKDRLSLSGVIGAQTAYSSGEGTVSEWKAAARKAGLDFLVFLESFDQLNPADLESLKRDCRRLSDNTILLVPGFASRNFIGMANYYISPDLPYPKKEMLAPDGKTWGDGRYYANNHRPGQLNELRQAYIWNLCATKVVCGYYNYSGMPVPPSDCGIYDTVPVLTARGTEFVEDSLRVYREACRDKQYPQAIGLQFLSSPEQLCLPGLVRTMAGFGSLADFRAWFSEQSLGARFLDAPALWVTAGPEIVAWQRLGGRDYIHRNPDEFVWQNALNKFRIKVRSDVALKSVEVWDGDKLFRRFLPAGKEFETEFWVDNRDQQRELILEVTDAAGRRAVGGRLLTKNQLLQQVNCGDRNNQLAGWLVRRQSDGSVLGGSGVPATPDKRVSQMFTLPSSVFKQDVKLGTGAFDGVPRYCGYPAVQEALLLHVDGAFHRFADDRQVSQTRWSSEENGSHQTAVSAFSNMDVLIGDRSVEDVFDDKVDVIHVWNTLWRIKPREYSTWTQRRFVLRPRGDQPLAMNIWQYRVKLKKDVDYGEEDPLGVDAVRMSSGGCQQWSLGPAGSSIVPVVQGNLREDEAPSGRAARVSDFGVGAWAAYTGSPGGGEIVFSLTPGLRIACPTGSPARPRFSIGLPPEDSPHKKGENAELWLLVVGVPRYSKGHSDRVAVADPVEVAQAIKTGLGIGCPPSYQARWQRGTPLPSDYVCRVRAEDGAVVGHFARAADLIAPVPVWVEGLSPNWTIVYCRGEKDRLRPVGQFEGTCRVLVDPSYGDVDLFVGHPVTAGSRELRIHVVRIGEGVWSVELHNPTSEPIATHCSSDPDWTRFVFQQDVTVPPGSSVFYQVPQSP